MVKEFNLIEKRKELKKDILKHFEKWEGTIEEKFDRYFKCIKEQDKDFIKNLKRHYCVCSYENGICDSCIYLSKLTGYKNDTKEVDDSDKDCYNCIKNDVCIDFIKNKVKKGKFVGCNKWFASEVQHE